VLQRTRSQSFRFAYYESWLQNNKAIPLSRSLPLQTGLFTGKKTRAFFSGILPEQKQREAIAGILGISADNEYRMLEELGGECAGAVMLYPDGVNPPQKPLPSLRELSENELIDILNELPSRPLMVGTTGLRFSLAGAQDKLPVIYANYKISLPLNDTPSTHILKPEPERFPGLALNEVFCMQLAKHVGLKVPDVEYLVIGDKPCILISRYDRVQDKHNHTIRIHQEDFCQALGIPPDRKYESEGGPGIRQCIALLRDWSSIPALDISQFIHALIFNVLIGNADAHGKNFSFLYPSNQRSLAPQYDLVSTIAWPRLSKHLAMTIGNNTSVNVFGIGAWKQMAVSCNLGWPMIRQKIRDISNLVLANAKNINIASHPGMDEKVNSLKKDLESRAKRMLQALSSQNV